MIQRTIILTLLTFIIISASAQKIKLEGKQTLDVGKDTPTLTCIPVKISKPMKISEVDGNCIEFWIQKGSVTIHKFINHEEAVGTVLPSGTYYVYPKLKKDSKKADVTITLVATIRK